MPARRPEQPGASRLQSLLQLSALSLALVHCPRTCPPVPRSPADVRYVVISPQTPEEFLEPGQIDDLLMKLGRGTANRRLGWMVRIYGLDETDAEVVRARLQRAFALAEEHDLPLAIHVDFEYAWKTRTDLWNWWDPTQPDYDPALRDNVEWTDWDVPTTERWINWGQPTAFAPHPCFGSPAVRAEVRARAAIIADEVEAWRQRLAGLNRSSLLIGVNPTSETDLFDFQSAGAPPGIPPEGQVRVGYCSLARRGYGPSNPPPDLGQALATEVQDFAHHEVAVFRERGLPRELLSTHIRVADDNWFNSPPWTAVNPDAIPGFSTYHSSSLPAIAAVTQGADWVIAEAPWRVVGDYLEAPGLRWIALYNWCHTCAPDALENIANNPDAQLAIRVALYGESVLSPHERTIRDAYRVLLGRAADAAEVAGWETQMAGGLSTTELLAAFFGSPEYQTSHGVAAMSNAEFVTFLYQSLLGRAPDAAGFADWLGRLDAGTATRADVFRGFVGSDEFKAQHPLLNESA